MFSGDFWSGRQAAEMGLVDGIADLRPKMRELFGEKVRLQRVDPSRSWIQRKLRMDGRQLTWARDMVGAIEERGIWSRYGL